MEILIFLVVICFFIVAFGWSGFGVCDEWNRKTLFTLGRFTKILGPGLYFYIPFLQRVRHTIDTRIITYIVPLQKGLTKDNIPVEVDAIVFYRVHNTKLAVLNVDNYHSATQLAVRSSIRDMVGKSNLDELLSERDKIGEIIMEHVAEFVSQWGILIIGIEIKDVIVSKELEDAISREAAAEREKRARVKLAEAEEMAVGSIAKAADQYKNNPLALELRSMNMLYEMCMEGKSTMIFVPTSSSSHAMPSLIGIEGIKDLLKTEKKLLSEEESE
jgi:regulator of protease activity HflC (stomatin/prohibitin superfamily)